MSKYYISLAFLFCSAVIMAQTFDTRTAHLYVKSSSKFMDVEADNYQVYSNVDFSSFTVNFTGLMKSWEFELGAFDRAFNSDRLNLDGYQKFSFEGIILDPESIDLNTPGRYEIKVKGPLFIGEYKRMMNATATCYVKYNGEIDVESDFSFQIEEANMEQINKLMRERIPQVVTLDSQTLGISRIINVKLFLTYKPQ